MDANDLGEGCSGIERRASDSSPGRRQDLPGHQQPRHSRLVSHMAGSAPISECGPSPQPGPVIESRTFPPAQGNGHDAEEGD